VVAQSFPFRPCGLTILSELCAHHANFFKHFQEQDGHIGKGFAGVRLMTPVCRFAMDGSVLFGGRQ